jgi:hypothetical protein
MHPLKASQSRKNREQNRRPFALRTAQERPCGHRRQHKAAAKWRRVSSLIDKLPARA